MSTICCLIREEDILTVLVYCYDLYVDLYVVMIVTYDIVVSAMLRST